MSRSDVTDHTPASRSTASRSRAPIRAAVLLGAGLALVLSACGGGAEVGGDDGEAPSEQSAPGTPTSGAAPGTAGACAEGTTDCDDMVEPGDPTDGDPAGSCLAGDPDCTDESYDGGDVARPLPVSSEPLDGEPADAGATSGATPTPLTGVHLLGDRRLQVGFDGDPCTVVEDVVVTTSEEEVRLLVLTGHEAGTDACVQSLVAYTTTVELDEPLGERTVLDLGG